MNEYWKWAVGMLVVIVALVLTAFGAFYMENQTTGLDWFFGGFGRFMLLSAGVSVLLLIYFVAKAISSENG